MWKDVHFRLIVVVYRCQAHEECSKEVCVGSHIDWVLLPLVCNEEDMHQCLRIGRREGQGKGGGEGGEGEKAGGEGREEGQEIKTLNQVVEQ